MTDAEPAAEDSAAGRFLCSGTAWDTSGARLTLHTPAGEARALRLDPGTELRFRILNGPDSPGRFCLGFWQVTGDGVQVHTPCPAQAAAGRGYQCGPCFARDEVRGIHNSHRSPTLPEPLRRYLDQPHWLYVATFADGATKVGTAANPRKQLRLIEQGAVRASYVARAANGLTVRVLEDTVTSLAGLPQAVRAGAKTAALTRPLAVTALEAVNAEASESARAALDSTGMDGFSAVEEQWVPPAQFATVLETPCEPYPTDPGAGEHGMIIEAVLGSTALVRVDGESGFFAADLSRLKGRRLETGAYRTRMPALQTALF
ncbi:DUF2797 domain-containing protein [Arthrobacter zhangbolii]|uniref:DUF2797 domain-containing protein n=1 Tax=Arthrobacter zhangbolii TaxID=2886936 RepID=A0A9X1SBB7_9MICC|nr:DUF2797 domain-containing protein [Arthrobacter zhangbolii]MCC3272654.1 DUF2797 domain-containing protein [Arthrobacter zhangbolii]UON91503.1 DUF2797 domain-containing protein [Arthrobacter zhangbolii]